jgi:hypothetical protein
LKHAVKVLVDFGEGQTLNVEVRKVARSWGNIKELIRVSREVAGKARQAEELKKELAGADDAKTAALTAEVNELEAESSKNVEVLIDWMVGTEDHPSAIADWDFYEDESQTVKVAIDRQRIEEFEPAEIATMAGAILGSLGPGEAKSAISAAQ